MSKSETDLQLRDSTHQEKAQVSDLDWPMEPLLQTCPANEHEVSHSRKNVHS